MSSQISNDSWFTLITWSTHDTSFGQEIYSIERNICMYFLDIPKRYTQVRSYRRSNNIPKANPNDNTEIPLFNTLTTLSNNYILGWGLGSDGSVGSQPGPMDTLQEVEVIFSTKLFSDIITKQFRNTFSSSWILEYAIVAACAMFEWHCAVKKSLWFFLSKGILWNNLV